MKPQSIGDWMTEKGLSLDDLVRASALEPKVVTAIVAGRYTPSPKQRQTLAQALGVTSDLVVWGHVNEVTHVYGHGPQFGRSP